MHSWISIILLHHENKNRLTYSRPWTAPFTYIKFIYIPESVYTMKVSVVHKIASWQPAYNMHGIRGGPPPSVGGVGENAFPLI